MPERLCERCTAAPARSNERFCKDCRKAILAELKGTGYLTPRAFVGRSYRPPEKREDVRETKRGIDR